MDQPRMSWKDKIEWKKKVTEECIYSKSPIYEWVPFREHVRASNLFLSPMNLA